MQTKESSWMSPLLSLRRLLSTENWLLTILVSLSNHPPFFWKRNKRTVFLICFYGFLAQFLLFWPPIALNVSVDWIKVNAGGKFIAGAPSCQITQRVTFTFHGNRSTANIIGTDPADGCMKGDRRREWEKEGGGRGGEGWKKEWKKQDEKERERCTDIRTHIFYTSLLSYLNFFQHLLEWKEWQSPQERIWNFTGTTAEPRGLALRPPREPMRRPSQSKTAWNGLKVISCSS